MSAVVDQRAERPTNSVLPSTESEGSVSLAEAVKLASVDPIFYSEYFFPRTARQSTPPFHRRMWDVLTMPGLRYIAMKIFRGGAKTSILRLFVSYCSAFGISHTVLFVGKSEDAAVKSVEWLMRAVERNSVWAAAFNLRKGNKWTSGEIEIWHGTENASIRIIAYGMTGSVRGVNVEDYRPDLIIVDDPCDEENTATPEARAKISELFFGALQKSLAPASEAPLAKMVLLQTVINEGDLISQCCKDAQWISLEFGCFDESGNSRWPARWSTNELMDEKQAHIDRNQLSLWLREMECVLVNSENALLRAEWIKYWEVIPETGFTWMAVDPTPPPKDGDRAKVNKENDQAAILVLRRYKGAVYVCETYVTISPDEDEFEAKFFELAQRWKCKMARVETVLFARMLASSLRKAMQRRKYWMTLHQIEDKRKKQTRIGQEVQPVVQAGNLYVHPSQVELIEQLTMYPMSKRDDCIDALSIGLAPLTLHDSMSEEGAEDLEGEFEEVEDLPAWRGAP